MDNKPICHTHRSGLNPARSTGLYVSKVSPAGLDEDANRLDQIGRKHASDEDATFDGDQSLPSRESKEKLLELPKLHSQEHFLLVIFRVLPRASVCRSSGVYCRGGTCGLWHRTCLDISLARARALRSAAALDLSTSMP